MDKGCNQRRNKGHQTERDQTHPRWILCLWRLRFFHFSILGSNLFLPTCIVQRKFGIHFTQRRGGSCRRWPLRLFQQRGGELSITPGFNPVTTRPRNQNRFNGFAPRGKPLKRFRLWRGQVTRLKPGVNETGPCNAAPGFSRRDSAADWNLKLDGRIPLALHAAFAIIVT